MSDVYLWETYEKVGREAMERRDFSQAIEAFRSAVAVAEGLAGEDLRLVMSLRHLSSATAKAGQLSLAHDLLGRTEEIAVTRLGGTHTETVQVKRDLYELCRQLGHLDQAETYLVEVLGVVRAQGETEEFLEILELLAQLAGERDRMDHAAELYQEIVEARTTLYGEDHPSVAQALLWLSTALSRSGRAEDAEAPLTRAFGLLERQFADDPKSLAQSLLAGAELMIAGGRSAVALEHQKRALELLSGTVDADQESLWQTREMMASTLASLGRLEESIELLELCLQHRQARDSRRAALLKNLAGLYLSLQKLDRAETLYQEASELLHQTLGPEHPASLAALEERIQLYHFSGRPQQALNLALTTIKPTEQRFGAGHPNTAQVYASTAVLAHAAGQWETAYELMKAAEAIWETLIPRPTEVLSNCRLNMATCLVELGRQAEAALALNKVSLPAESPLASVVRDLWARIETASGQPAAEGPARAAAPGPRGSEDSGKRRSIKLSLGGAFAGPRERAPVEPELPPQVAPQPEDYLPPAVGRPIWAPKEPEVVLVPAAVAVSSGENPFDDITFTQLEPEADIAELRASEEVELPAEGRLAVGPETLPAAETDMFAVDESADFFSESSADLFALVAPLVEPALPDAPEDVVPPPEGRAEVEAESEPEPLEEPATEAGAPLQPAPADFEPVEVARSSEPANFEPPDTAEVSEPANYEPPDTADRADRAEASEPANSEPVEVAGTADPQPASPPPLAEAVLWDDLPRRWSEDDREPPARAASDPEPAPEQPTAAPASDRSQEAGEALELEPIPQASAPGEEEHDVSSDLPGEELVALDVREWVPEDGDERREHRRFNLGLNRFFDLSLVNAKGELHVVRSFLVDLSAGGLRVNTELPLPMKETFQLTLPAELLEQEVQVPARVTWQRALFGATYIQGVEFVGVSDEQQALLEAVLSGGLHESGRQHYRLYRPFPIQISYQDHAEWISSYASDLSVEGVGTRLTDEIRTGQQIRLRLGLEFELPAVEVAATVAWNRYGSNGVSHGLRFEEVGPVEARTIRLYIDRCLELSPD